MTKICKMNTIRRSTTESMMEHIREQLREHKSLMDERLISKCHFYMFVPKDNVLNMAMECMFVSEDIPTYPVVYNKSNIVHANILNNAGMYNDESQKDLREQFTDPYTCLPYTLMIILEDDVLVNLLRDMEVRNLWIRHRIRECNKELNDILGGPFEVDETSGYYIHLPARCFKNNEHHGKWISNP